MTRKGIRPPSLSLPSEQERGFAAGGFAARRTPHPLPSPTAEEGPCERSEANEREDHAEPSGRGDFLALWNSPEARGESEGME